jgi:Ca2+-transporting ATPase
VGANPQLYLTAEGCVATALRGDDENTPLQLKLNALAELIAKLGSCAGLLLFVALMIRFFVQLGINIHERQSSTHFINAQLSINTF